jgi:CRISPR/Cas system-associated exonuclease Cas4 (RecB family)
MLYLSPSKIATYKQCPFKYKCESDPQIKRAYKQDHPDPIFGNLIHACLTDYFLLPENKRTHEELRRIFKEKFMKNYDKHLKIFKNKTAINHYIEEEKKQFKTFIDSSFSSGNLLPMEEKLLKWTIDGKIIFMGLVDRVDLDNNKLTIIDYKTGKLREENKDDRQFQVDCYEYLIAKKYPEYKITKKILFFLKENKIVEYKVKDVSDTEKEILTIASIVEEDAKMEPRKNNLCNYCDYKIICPLFSNL